MEEVIFSDVSVLFCPGDLCSIECRDNLYENTLPNAARMIGAFRDFNRKGKPEMQYSMALRF